MESSTLKLLAGNQAVGSSTVLSAATTVAGLIPFI